MLRATLVSLSLGVVSAGMTEQCMQSLQHLQGESDMELAVRCRAAFGPQACKQAKQALGAQPWSQTRMQKSCAVFAESYEGLDARSLEAAVEKKRSTPTEETLQDKPASGFATAASAPVDTKPQGPVANLLNKLKEQKKKDEAKQKPSVDAAPEKSESSDPLVGMIQKMKDARSAHEVAKPQDKAQTQEGSALIEEDEEGPLTAMLKKMVGPKKAATPAVARSHIEQDEQGPLVTMFKRAEAQSAGEPLLKLYGDMPSQRQADASNTAQALVALGGAVLIAALILVAVSRRVDFHGRHGHDELFGEPDAESME